MMSNCIYLSPNLCAMIKSQQSQRHRQQVNLVAHLYLRKRNVNWVQIPESPKGVAKKKRVLKVNKGAYSN